MEVNFKSDIKTWLDNLEALKPVPTTFCPNLKTDSPYPVKAVIFDIYGTLLISSSGDIDQASLSNKNMSTAMQAGGFNIQSCKTDVCSFLLDQTAKTNKSAAQTICLLKAILFPMLIFLKFGKICLKRLKKKAS